MTMRIVGNRAVQNVIMARIVCHLRHHRVEGKVKDVESILSSLVSRLSSYCAANWAFFIFMPARFTVVAPKINDLQMTLFPFFFGKSFF